MDKLERELLQEWVLKRAVGREALSVGSSMSSADPKTMRVDSLAVAEAGAIVDLEPPAPGRIRLLSGGHGNLQPWYNDGSHGQQWSRENDTPRRSRGIQDGWTHNRKDFTEWITKD
jgi:hypothetical protein